MIVAIEGMDGVGKTTLAKRLVKELDYKYIKEPLEELFEVDSIIKISEKVFKNYNSNFIALYLSLGDNYVLQKYKGENVIIDRHVLLNYYWNGNSENDELFKVENKLFGKPDLTIVLEASVETRRKRLMDRDKNDKDLNDLNKMQYGYDKMIDFLNENNYCYRVIHTDNLSIDKVYQETINILNEFNK